MGHSRNKSANASEDTLLDYSSWIYGEPGPSIAVSPASLVMALALNKPT